MADLNLKVRGDSGEASAALLSLADSAKKLAEAAEGAGHKHHELAEELIKAEIAVELLKKGFELLVDVAKESVEEYAKQEKAVAQLSGAFHQLGYEDVPGLTEAMKRQAEGFQSHLAVSKVMVEQMQALMVRFGVAPRDIDATTRAVLDYSAATGRDALGSTEQLLHGVERGGAGLRRMGIDIKETGSKSEALHTAIDALGTKFGGAAAVNAETLSGQLKAMDLEMGELKEGFGRFIAEINTKYTVITTLTEMIHDLRKQLFSSEEEDSDDERQKADDERVKELNHEQQMLKIKLDGAVERKRKDELALEEAVGSANIKYHGIQLVNSENEVEATQKRINAIDGEILAIRKKTEEEKKSREMPLPGHAPGFDDKTEKEKEERRKFQEGFLKQEKEWQRARTEAQLMGEAERAALQVKFAKEDEAARKEKSHKLLEEIHDETDTLAAERTAVEMAHDIGLLDEQIYREKLLQLQRQANQKELQEEKKVAAEMESIKKSAIGGVVGALQGGLTTILELSGASAEAIAASILKQTGSVLLGIGIQSGVRAYEEAALSTASFASGDPAGGALHATASTQFIIAAAAAGAGGIGASLAGSLLANDDKSHSGSITTTGPGGSTGSVSATFSSPSPAGHYHQGGWAGLPRFHNGGEVPAVLLSGERVLSIPEVDRMGGHSSVDRMAAGGGESGPRVVQFIQTVDASSYSNYMSNGGGRAMKRVLVDGRGEWAQLMRKNGIRA